MHKLESVQCLRGFAAMGVVVHHAIRMLSDINEPLVGLAKTSIMNADVFGESLAFGVDVFFVLSGFIMVFVAEPYLAGQRSLKDFFLRRFLRIYPLYFLVTLYIVDHSPYLLRDAPAIIKSFLFIPYHNDRGLIQPLLGVGWTLQYEMLFYAIFGVALAFGRKCLVTVVALQLLCLLTGSWLVRQYVIDTAVTRFLSNPILIEFLLGCLLGLAWNANRINCRLPWLTVFVAVSSLFLTQWLAAESYVLLRRGLLATLLVWGMLGLDYRRTQWPAWCLLLGDASYSIYLVHVVIIYNWVRKPLEVFVLRSGNGYTTDLLVIFGSILALVAGLAVYFLCERPLNRFFQAMIQRRSDQSSSRTHVVA